MQRLTIAAIAVGAIAMPALAQHIGGGGSGGGGGGVTSVATACGVIGGPITGTGTVQDAVLVNARSGTSYSLVAGDCGKLVTSNNAGAVTFNLLAPGTAGSGYWFQMQTLGAGTTRLSPASGQINGAAYLDVLQGQGVSVATDGSNYFAVTGLGAAGAGVSSFNTRTGAVTLSSGDVSGVGGLLAANNLADLASAATARSNLGLGTFATQNAATPPAIGGTTPAAGAFTTLSASGNLTSNITGATQCVHANSGGVLSGTGSDCGTGGGGITSLALGGGLTITPGAANASPAIGTSTIYPQTFPNTYTGSHTITGAELAGIDYCNSGSAMTLSLPQAGTAGFEEGTSLTIANSGAGDCTISTTTSNFYGVPLVSGSIVLAQNSGVYLVSDGTNWGATGVTKAGVTAAMLAANAVDLTAAAITGTLPASHMLGLANGNLYQGNGSSQPASVTLSAAIDAAIGSVVQGDLLYRGASGWARLGAGTNGEFLKTQGASANPLWATISGGSGCATTGSANQLLVDNGSGGCTSLPYTAPTSIAAHQLVVATSTSATAAKTVPDCTDSGGNHLNYTQSSDAFSCGTSASGGGGAGFAGPIRPSTVYLGGAGGNLFPNFHAGAGGNAAAHDEGIGVVASIAADATAELRYILPPAIPGSGTLKQRCLFLANDSSHVIKYTVSDADVAAGASPSAATLTSETQNTVTWSTGDADKYKEGLTTLSATPSANDMLVVALKFQTSGWTMNQVVTASCYVGWF